MRFGLLAALLSLLRPLGLLREILLAGVHTDF